MKKDILIRKQQPSIQSIEKINLVQPQHSNLDNGIPVYLLNSGSQELVKIEFLFNAGVYHQSKKLQASLTNKMLSKGTTSYSSFEIAETIDNLGAYLSSQITHDHSSVAIYVLNKHIYSILPVLKEIITDPVFSDNEFSVLINKLKQEFIINLEKVKFLASINFTNLIFGNDHPYGWMSVIGDFENITVNDLKDSYQKNYSPTNCTIIVSGKIENGITKQLNNVFGCLKDKNTPHVISEYHIKHHSGKKQKIEKANAVQSAIRIGKSLFNKSHNDYIGMQFLNTVLGGYFGSRLMSNIREDKGYTYGIGSSLVSLKKSGYFSISTEVGSQYTNTAIDEIFKEINRLKTEKINDTELDLVKNYLLGQLIRGLDGPFALHEKFKSVFIHDMEIGYYEKFIKEIMSMKPSRLIELANKYWEKDTFTELIVGKSN